MGARHSSQPRSVSMENPTPAGVIDISDDVVKRLKQGISQQAREHAIDEAKAKPAPPPPPSPPKQQPRKAVKPLPPAASSSPAQTSVVYPAATPIYIAGGHTITAADVRRQMETELKENDDVWRKRLVKLEETLKKTNSIMESECATAVDDVRKRFVSTSTLHQPPPCGDLKKQLLACYRASPSQTLKCTEEVTQFRSCVEAHRIKKLEPTTLAEQSKSATAKAAVVPAKAG